MLRAPEGEDALIADLAGQLRSAIALARRVIDKPDLEQWWSEHAWREIEARHDRLTEALIAQDRRERPLAGMRTR